MSPSKKSAGEKLGRNPQMVNRQISRLRSVVEQIITPVKTWRVLHSGFRRSWGGMVGCFLLVWRSVSLVAGYPYE